MNVKQKLITLFENNRGAFLSGEELAEKLDCSRAAVWKAVTSLRGEGYAIDAVTGRGYRLAPATDVLSAAGIEKYLPAETRDITLDVRRRAEGSTNDILREAAGRGAPAWTVLVCGEQTGGKGRLGRSFFSPSDSGLYISILLRPDMPAADSVRITTAAAAAVAKAIEDCTESSPRIKWVNDIYVNGKKVCGILTEAAFSLENGGLDYAVAGIGIFANGLRRQLIVGDFAFHVQVGIAAVDDAQACLLGDHVGHAVLKHRLQRRIYQGGSDREVTEGDGLIDIVVDGCAVERVSGNARLPCRGGYGDGQYDEKAFHYRSRLYCLILR